MTDNSALEQRVQHLEETLSLVIAAATDLAAAVGPSPAKDAYVTLHRARKTLEELAR